MKSNDSDCWERRVVYSDTRAIRAPPPSAVGEPGVTMRMLRYLWAAPTTLIGVLLVPLAYLGRGRVAVIDGVLEASGGLLGGILRRCTLLRDGVSALTLGHVVLAQDLECATRTRDHERVHVRQYEQWGPFFLPAYLAASLWALALHGNFYRDNWFERVAHRTCDPSGSIARADGDTDSPTGKPDHHLGGGTGAAEY